MKPYINTWQRWCTRHTTPRAVRFVIALAFVVIHVGGLIAVVSGALMAVLTYGPAATAWVILGSMAAMLAWALSAP